MKIYHNPRCSKSRQGLQILKDAQVEFEIVDYLKNPPSEEEIKEILNKLKIPPLALVRKSEQIWKDEFKHKSMSDQDIIKAMHNHPKLIERPIVVKGNMAVIGRPPENIKQLI
ncbi:arsenate reductase (glutaredoxin) [Flavobacteriaceae bacterium F08102]|nr:arsenate reductase (glutaredoxin) [Flavobacteriaceae bacterium F08102]